MVEAVARERVREALSKKAEYGPDVDLTQFRLEKPRVAVGDPDASLLAEAQRKVGLNPGSISYFQAGETAFYKMMEATLAKMGVVVKPLRIALKEDERARRIAWSLVPPDKDKYTAAAYLYGGELGYYVYVPPGVRVEQPIYTCLSLFTGGEVQFTHNIVYVDEGAEAHVTTGCMVPHGVKGGLHIGISEFYVAPGAKLGYTMLHSWAPGVHVRPRTAVRVEEGGEYHSYYAVYSPVASIQSYPQVRLARGAYAKLTSIVSAEAGGVYDLGGRAVLEGEGAAAEMVSRVMAREGSTVVARNEIDAKTGGTRGHIECLGLLLDDASRVDSVPIISSLAPGAELTHEAAIGSLSEENIAYLEAKGFTEEEARALLLRGFLSVEEPGLPPLIRSEIERIVDFIVKNAVG